MARTRELKTGKHRQFDKGAKQRTCNIQSPARILIDLNHILLFIAIVSPLILLVRIARLRNMRNRGWRIASLIVLAASLLAWLAVPGIAGFIGGICWALLLLVPSLTERRIDDWLLVGRLADARRGSVVRRMLHPWDDTPYRAALFRCLELAHAGQLDHALDQLATERAAATPAGRFAMALTYALTENWPGLVQWCRRDLSVTENPAILSLFLRGLGETGGVDDLVLVLAARPAGREGHLPWEGRALFDLAIGLAFAGKVPALVRLFGSHLARLPRGQQELWLGTAELVAGKTDAGRARLERLRRETKDAVLQRSIERRLAAGRKFMPLSDSSEILLTRLSAETAGAEGSAPRRNAQGAPAVWALILLNLAMFGVEMALGGASNVAALRNLGGLDPAAVVVRQEYWRFLTALFLHYGVLHLGINLFGLYLLGPALERTIGSIKFAVGYLLSGLGSGLLVVLLWRFGLSQSSLLVGASGCIMGVIGMQAGLLLRHRASSLAGRQLRDIIAIVAIQIVFDLWTPQVSLAAHLGGVITGFLIGLVLATGRKPPPSP
ncbi:MAG: rhomboid family intramembrane serine protease [Verrucomicrobiota bacterium]|nr:rhomboid family intramembrane serine protease [Verrucomicrobiota bacterium]